MSEDDVDRRGSRIPLVVVTGLSGAGLSSALKSLEDNKFDVIDNLPLPLFRAMLDNPAQVPDAPLAVGIDSRTRGLEPSAFSKELEELRRDPRFEVAVLFLDCEDEVLRRRFTETRRRHPMADDDPVPDGIVRERQLMEPLRQVADLVLDTSGLTVHELRKWVFDRLGDQDRSPLTLTIISFAYRGGLPKEADLVFDVRFLRNPHYVDALRAKTGLDADVQAYVRDDPGFAPFVANTCTLLEPLLPRYLAEGKSYLTIAIGCTGGQHRSVFMATVLQAWLRGHGWPSTLIHREISRRQGGTGRSPFPASGTNEQGIGS